MKLAMGIYDAPQKQDHLPFDIDNWTSNIAVFGGPMSGKTTFIKTLLVRIYENTTPFIKEDVYIIDFGGNIGAYGQLNNVCACFNNSNEENIKRIFRVIENRLEENSKKLGSQNFYSLATKNPEKCPAHITLIIENLNAFLADERYSSYQDRLIQLSRDGLSKGLSIVVTANDLSGTSRLLANFGQKIAFEMPADNYFEIFNSKIVKPMKIPGRCVVNIESATYECQIFLPFANTDATDEIEKLIRKSKFIANPNKLLSFPEVLECDNVSEYCKECDVTKLSSSQVLVGLDYYEHSPIIVDTKEARAIAIYGKRKFGKTNLLTGMIEQIAKNNENTRFVFLEDGREEIKELYDRFVNRSERFYNVIDFIGYLVDKGYVAQSFTPLKKESALIKDNPPTVFVLQGRSFYQGSFYKGVNHSNTLLRWIAEDMIARAEDQNYLFIFSDVKSIPDVDMRVRFNNIISSAFLLDNIAEYISERGNGNKSVFGDMDAKELKFQYAKCSVGDGYYYGVETDVLKKLKFIKFI